MNRFPEDMDILEDQVFSIRCALRAQTFVLLKNRNYFYYSCPTSITHQNVSRANDIVRCINYIQESLRGVEDKVILNYFNQCYFPNKIQMLLDYVRKFGGLEAAPSLLIRPTTYLKGWKVWLKYLVTIILRKNITVIR